MPKRNLLVGTGTPWSRLKKLETTKEVLGAFADCLIKQIIKEAKKDFAKRGWPLTDPNGGPRLQDSFSYKIKNDTRLEIYTSFYGLTELMHDEVPPHKMDWLTQENKKSHPERFKKTTRERQLGKRLPLVVPIESQGRVVFRMAPLKTSDAWIHPGIARFNFAQRALNKGLQDCMLKVIGRYIAETLSKGNPFK